MDAVALAARELSDELLLVGALEVEARRVTAAGSRVVADGDVVEAVGDLLPCGLRIVERVAALVDVGDLHRVTDPELPRVGFLLPHQHPEERRLAGAVRTDDADDAAARQPEGEVLEKKIVVERFL